MEKQIIEMVDVRGHEPLPKDDSSIIWSDHSNEYILKIEALEHVAHGEIVHRDYEDDYSPVPSRDDLLYLLDDLVWSSIVDEYVHGEDAIKDYDEEVFATDYIFSDHSEYTYVSRGIADGCYVYYDNVAYCEDIGDHVYIDDANWCELDGNYYYDTDSMPVNRDDRSIIHAYHHGPDSNDLSEFAQFRIGFEVEKTSLNGYDEEGDEVGEYEMFARFENDSSCGTEAITHILPLSGVRSKRRKKVFKMMDDAADIINGPYTTDCGGHITISVALTPQLAKRGLFLKPIDLLEKLRGNLAIVYALYRYRLNNSYCSACKDLKNPASHSGHLVVELKHNIRALEVRLFNKVMNVHQLKLRYDLMYILVRRSLDGTNFFTLLNEVEPIIRKMYNNDNAKVANIRELANMFRDYLIADVIHDRIESFINDEDNND
jgi:hypothetical protein